MAKKGARQGGKAVDALPEELVEKFLIFSYQHSEFMGDMMTICREFGLRNSEARELRASHISLSSNKVYLHDSKQVRGYITKHANKVVNSDWMIQGRKLLRREIPGDFSAILVRMATGIAQLDELAEEYDLTKEYNEARKAHHDSHIEEAKRAAIKAAPKGRVIDFKHNPRAKAILKKRIAKYGDVCDFLFPTNELPSNRAKGSGFEPIKRQSVNRIIESIRQKMESCEETKEALKGVKTGLHSMRKTAVQHIASNIDLRAASMWVGHGNGKGSTAMTEEYLNRSQQFREDINKQIADLDRKRLN